MKYFFPDSTDLVDPSFDFETETRSEYRVRQRDDHYAHEVLATPPYDGILVSKAVVDQRAGGSGRYTIAQKQRLLREGVRRFFRLDERPETRRLETMGDCGAFSYVREEKPPYTVDQVIEFYVDCGFDYGMSVDHVILGYKPQYDEDLGHKDSTTRNVFVPDAMRDRQELTLELAVEFLARIKSDRLRLIPYGVAQGWSPDSYAYAVQSLQSMGYKRIGLGGVVPLKTPEVLETLGRIEGVRRVETQIHLLGITRLEQLSAFESFGVTSFDSTSPLRQAFKDDRDNYWTERRPYQAIRIPQVEGNLKLQRRIRSGEVDQAEARQLELSCLKAVVEFEQEKVSADAVLSLLVDYERLCGLETSTNPAYGDTLRDRPWRKCPCSICQTLGIHVVLFRGAERNRRRGFHNLTVLYDTLQKGLDAISEGNPVPENELRGTQHARSERVATACARD